MPDAISVTRPISGTDKTLILGHPTTATAGWAGEPFGPGAGRVPRGPRPRAEGGDARAPRVPSADAQARIGQHGIGLEPFACYPGLGPASAATYREHSSEDSANPPCLR